MQLAVNTLAVAVCTALRCDHCGARTPLAPGTIRRRHASNYAVAAAAFANVPLRSCAFLGPKPTPFDTRTPVWLTIERPWRSRAALLVQTCGGHKSPPDPETHPYQDGARTIADTIDRSPNTGHEPRCPATRNSNPSDQERVPSTTHQHLSRTCTHMRTDRTGLGFGVIEEMTGRSITVPFACRCGGRSRRVPEAERLAANGVRELGVLCPTVPGTAEGASCH